MNVGEKVCLYKEKLGFRNYQDFGKAVGVPGDWLLDLSKKDEVKFIDMNHLIKLCNYLSISIDQLVKEDNPVSNTQAIETSFINESCDDIGAVISEMTLLLDKDGIRLDGTLLNDSAKQICKDSLDVVRTLTKQYL